jgi:soluble lytic murein transglycosylase-like protein
MGFAVRGNEAGVAPVGHATCERFGATEMRRRDFLAGIIAGSLPVVARAHVVGGAAAPASDKLVASIARRYRVAEAAVERVAAIAAKHFPSDPALLLAVVGVESSWRPWALGSVGEVGLCQVRPELHGASAADLIDPESNIEVAARVLRGCLARSRGDVAGALRRYNGTGPAAERYAVKVLAEHRRLLAAQRRSIRKNAAAEAAL